MPRWFNAECLQERTAGIDYYRCILGEREDTRAALNLVSSIQLEDVGQGSARKPWQFQGYKGWMTDRVRYGMLDWRMLWETSGTAAPAISRLLAPCGGRATRVDVQTTVTFSRPQPAFGTHVLSPLRSTPLHPRSSPKRVGVSKDSTGYWCGTVGPRTSDRYFRVYDKGVEAGTHEPGRRWRLELEAKKQMAPFVAEAMATTDEPDRQAYNLVTGEWIAAGGIWPVSDPPTTHMPFKKQPKEQSNAERLSVWLAASVRPTMPRLLEVFSVREVLEMLGLSEHAMPLRADDADGN